jgi:hypothetical protein
MITRDQAEIAAKKLRQELPDEYEVKVHEVSPGSYVILGGIPCEKPLNPNVGVLGYFFDSYIGAANLPSKCMKEGAVYTVSAGHGARTTKNFYQAVDWIVDTINNIQKSKT